MSDERATPEEMIQARKLQDMYDAGYALGQAEERAKASRAAFDDWLIPGMLPEDDALWMAWQAGMIHGLTE